MNYSNKITLQYAKDNKINTVSYKGCLFCLGPSSDFSFKYSMFFNADGCLLFFNANGFKSINETVVIQPKRNLIRQLKKFIDTYGVP